MKLVHTADWQIGMKAAHTGTAASRVREARLDAARNVIGLARERGADLLVVAGDTFEDNGVDRLLVQKIADILASFPGQVIVIPGNHDPLVPGSVWEHPAWRSASARNVRVALGEEPIEVPGGWILPCPAREKHSASDPTAWIARAAASDGRGNAIRLGVAHGTVEGVRQDEPDYPIPRDAAQRGKLDYLALGHWHSTAVYSGTDGAQRMAYSGTHETTKFGERDSGNALLVEISAPGAPPRLTPLRTGSLSWITLDSVSRGPGDVARVRQEVEAMEAGERVLLEVQLEGVLHPGDGAELERLEEILAARFLHGRLDRSHLILAPADEAWLERLPPGPLREAAARLRDLANPAFHGPRPEGATAETARAALLELYALCESLEEALP